MHVIVHIKIIASVTDICCAVGVQLHSIDFDVVAACIRVGREKRKTRFYNLDWAPKLFLPGIVHSSSLQAFQIDPRDHETEESLVEVLVFRVRARSRHQVA